MPVAGLLDRCRKSRFTCSYVCDSRACFKAYHLLANNPLVTQFTVLLDPLSTALCSRSRRSASRNQSLSWQHQEVSDSIPLQDTRGTSSYPSLGTFSLTGPSQRSLEPRRRNQLELTYRPDCIVWSSKRREHGFDKCQLTSQLASIKEVLVLGLHYLGNYASSRPYVK